MSSNEAGDLFRQGDLAGAIAAAEQKVKRNPAGAGERLLLAEILLFSGDVRRADVILAAVEAIEPDAALTVAEFRQLLRAATARQEVWREGRIPDFLGEPTPHQTSILRSLVALRAGDAAAAAEAADAAEAERPHKAGRAGDVAFDDFRDADDLCSGSLEVLTTTGKYFWIPAERVVSMEFEPPKRPRDLCWRRCSMIVLDGPDGVVYVPMLYDKTSDDASLRLGRGTTWSPSAPVRGCGQRIFLVGDEGVPVGQMQSVEFA